MKCCVATNSPVPFNKDNSIFLSFALLPPRSVAERRQQGLDCNCNTRYNLHRILASAKVFDRQVVGSNHYSPVPRAPNADLCLGHMLRWKTGRMLVLRAPVLDLSSIAASLFYYLLTKQTSIGESNCKN